ncbi:MAG: hypothetical protein R2799_13325 [Crocinitomicaceae bacterium]
MKVIYTIFFSLLLVQLNAQNLGAFKDRNDYFVVFDEGELVKLEYQLVSLFYVKNQCVAYIDPRDNFMIYWNKKKERVSPQVDNIYATDNLVVFAAGPILKVWEGGQTTLLTMNAGKYHASDSLVIFEQTLDNSIHVYYNGQKKEVDRGVFGTVVEEGAIGYNTLVYQNRVKQYNLIHRGRQFPLFTWTDKVAFSCGQNIVAYNDPVQNVFMVYDDEEFIEVETLPAKSMQAGRGFVVYEDANSNLKMYKDGQILEDLSSYSPDWYKVKDSMVVFAENQVFKVYDGEKVVTLENFIPDSYSFDNKSIAWRNNNGGVDAYIDGEKKTLTNEWAKEFYVNGNTIVMELPNKKFKIYWRGKFYES